MHAVFSLPVKQIVHAHFLPPGCYCRHFPPFDGINHLATTLVQEAAARHEKELAEERQRQKVVLDEQRSAILSLQDRMQKRQASLVQAKEEVRVENPFRLCAQPGYRGERGEGGTVYEFSEARYTHIRALTWNCTVESVRGNLKLSTRGIDPEWCMADLGQSWGTCPHVQVRLFLLMYAHNSRFNYFIYRQVLRNKTLCIHTPQQMVCTYECHNDNYQHFSA